MKRRTIILTGVIASCALLVTVTLGRINGSRSVKTSSLIPPKPETLPISETGPYPKAVVDEREHNFGTIGLGAEGSHAFIVRNEGEAPLRLKQVGSSCKCTIGKVAGDSIPPGESGEVILTWKTKKRYDTFGQWAKVNTNDPENKYIKLVIRGRIVPGLMTLPKTEWPVGQISEDAPTIVSGSVISPLHDEFQILSLESSSPFLTADYTPLSKVDARNLKAKSGYGVQLTIEPKLQAGHFRETVTIQTDIDGESRHVWFVSGSRVGPYQFLSVRGTRWYPAARVAKIGRFKASEGNTSSLLLFVSGMGDQELELLDIECDADPLKIKLTPDPNFTGKSRKRCMLEMKIAPNSPAAIRGGKNPVNVKLKTNHPQSPEVSFIVHYAAY